MTQFSSLLWLSNFPLYIWSHLYPFIYWWIFSLLPCLGFVNNAAVKIAGTWSFCIMVFSHYMNSCWIAGWYDSCISSFKETSTVAVPISMPPSNPRRSCFLHTLSCICCLWTFWWCPFWPLWIDNCTVDLIQISLIFNAVEHLFICFFIIWISY